MSELSRKRSLFAALFTILISPALFAGYPSPRFEARMVWVASTGHFILFGGSTAVDHGTKVAYELNDTWELVDNRWIELHPAHTPGARRGHVMIYDPVRDQVVLFGGRRGTTDLNDTWIFRNGDWTRLNPFNSPSNRVVPGAAYDVNRDRIVLFGGTQISADGKTNTALHDTWEFDGTEWIRIADSGPELTKPLLAYDRSRKTMVMLALDNTGKTAMYTYDAAAKTWNAVTGATLPSCVNEGQLVFQSRNNTLLYTGGICADSTEADETWEWDGSNWNKVTLTSPAIRVFGGAVDNDYARNFVFMFGGQPIAGVPLANSYIYAEGAWLAFIDPLVPAPRSLFIFNTDPAENTIRLYGGVNDLETFADFWRYDNGQWALVPIESGPASCVNPLASADTDRKKLVVICSASDTWEFDGSAWKQFTGLKNYPLAHQFSSMVYDANLKKTVFFGGYNANYLDETWTWDGAQWARVKNNPAPSRALATMWYDPIMKKTLLYGGIGRLSSDDRITRFSDMWAFDGNGWTELKPTGGTPGTRYGALSAVDPRTGKLMLFGGLRVDVNGTTQTQVFANDQWQWDGGSQTWTKITTATVPPARENGGIAYDPLRDEMVMYGGYAGYYLSDAWSFKNGNWTPRSTAILGRRRSAGR